MDLEWMARDCETLVQQLAIQKDKTFALRADALTSIIRMLGYRIVWRKRVSEDLFAYTQFDEWKVVLAKDLRKRMDSPGTYGAFLHATLSHELGHIRMHASAALLGRRGPDWENEAYAYSCAFLLPYHDLMDQPECRVVRAGLLQDQETLWKQVLRLAQHYKVSGAFMVHALQRYGVIRFDSRRRTIKPCTILGRKKTRPRMKYFSVKPNECLLGQVPGRGVWF